MEFKEETKFILRKIHRDALPVVLPKTIVKKEILNLLENLVCQSQGGFYILSRLSLICNRILYMRLPHGTSALY